MKRIVSLVLAGAFLSTSFGQDKWRKEFSNLDYNGINGPRNLNGPQRMADHSPGKFVFGGEHFNSWPTDMTWDPFIVESDYAGTTINSVQFPMDKTQENVGVIKIEPNSNTHEGFILYGNSFEQNQSNFQSNHVFLLKTNMNYERQYVKEVQFENEFGAFENLRIRKVKQMNDGNIVLIGSFQGDQSAAFNKNMICAKINAENLEIIWSGLYDIDENNYGYVYGDETFTDIVDLGNNEYVLTGYEQYSLGEYSFITKINGSTGQPISCKQINLSQNGKLDITNLRREFNGLLLTGTHENSSIVTFQINPNLNSPKNLSNQANMADFYSSSYDIFYNIMKVEKIDDQIMIQSAGANDNAINRSWKNLILKFNGDPIFLNSTQHNNLVPENTLGYGQQSLLTSEGVFTVFENTNSVPSKLSLQKLDFNYEMCTSGNNFYTSIDHTTSGVSLENIDILYSPNQVEENPIEVEKRNFELQESINCKECIVNNIDFDLSTTTGTTSLCSNINSSLDILAPQGFNSYKWFLNGHKLANWTYDLTIYEPGTYYCLVTDANGCTSLESITITDIQAPDLTLHNIEFCSLYGNPEPLGYNNDILSTFSQTATYSWTLDGSSFNPYLSPYPNPHHVTFQGTGYYEVTMNHDCGQTIEGFTVSDLLNTYSNHIGANFSIVATTLGWFNVLNLTPNNPGTNHVWNVVDQYGNIITVNPHPSLPNTWYIPYNSSNSYTITLTLENGPACEIYDYTVSYRSRSTRDGRKSMFAGNDDDIKLFPNPAKTEFEIQGGDVTSLQIFDNQGRVVKQVESPLGRKIDIAELNPGVYIVKVLSGTESKTLKLVKE